VDRQLETDAKQWPPRIVIAAPQGRSGKTIVSLGLGAAFRERGLVVQPFKKGPDYIDPSWLTAAAGRDCRNLDAVLMPEEAVLASFARAGQGADLALVEGAMGLYDGFDAAGWGSTAHIARLLGSPVILVVNCSRMTGSIAAMVGGYQHFQPEINIDGVILNNVSGSRHEGKLRAAIAQHCGIPVVGSIPRDESLNITERHLGLVPFREAAGGSIVERLCHRLKGSLDLDKILDIARQATARYVSGVTSPERKAAVVRVGIMLDSVFTFYYPENLEALSRAGAELVSIDSLRAQQLPDIDALYIGGGFPEVFLPELEANRGLRRDIAQAIEGFLPVYAECAGLMYLCRGIRWHGRWHEMVGVIPSDVEIGERPQGHGYVQLETTADNPLFPGGLTLWGHEFHHSRLSRPEGVRFAYRVRRGQGIDGQLDGIVYKNILAAYTHLHALGVPQWAEAFVSLARRERRRRSVSTVPT